MRCFPKFKFNLINSKMATPAAARPRRSRLLLLTDDVVIGIFGHDSGSDRDNRDNWDNRDDKDVRDHTNRVKDGHNSGGTGHERQPAEQGTCSRDVAVLLSGDGNFVYITDGRGSESSAGIQANVYHTVYTPHKYFKCVSETIAFRNKFARTKFMCSRFHSSSEQSSLCSQFGQAQTAHRLWGKGLVYWTLPVDGNRPGSEYHCSTNNKQKIRHCSFNRRICVVESVSYDGDNGTKIGHVKSHRQHTIGHGERRAQEASEDVAFFEYLGQRSIYTRLTCPITQYQLLRCLEATRATNCVNHFKTLQADPITISRPMTRSVDTYTTSNMNIFSRVVHELGPDLAMLLSKFTPSAVDVDGCNSELDTILQGSGMPAADCLYISSAAFVVLVESIDGSVFALDINMDKLTIPSVMSKGTCRKSIEGTMAGSMADFSSCADNALLALREMLSTSEDCGGDLAVLGKCHQLFDVCMWTDSEFVDSEVSSADNGVTRESFSSNLLALSEDIFQCWQAVSSQTETDERSLQCTEFHMKLLLSTRDSTETTPSIPAARPLSPVDAVRRYEREAVRMICLQEHAQQRLHILREYILQSTESYYGAHDLEVCAGSHLTRICLAFMGGSSASEVAFDNSRDMTVASSRLSARERAITEVCGESAAERIDHTISALSGVSLDPVSVAARISPMVSTVRSRYHVLNGDADNQIAYESTQSVVQRHLQGARNSFHCERATLKETSHRVETVNLECGTRLSAFFNIRQQNGLRDDAEEICRLRGAFPNKLIVDIDCNLQVCLV
jgi:hypothetical protein